MASYTQALFFHTFSLAPSGMRSMTLAKKVCLPLLGTMVGSVAFCALCEPFRAYNLMKLVAQVYIFASLAAVPVSVVLAVIEWRKPERAIGWPLILLLAGLPLPLIAAVFWNSPD